MSLPTQSQFLDAIRDARTLDDAGLLELQSRHNDIPSLAHHVRAQGLLTDFQIDEILAGRGDRLKLGPYRIVEKVNEQPECVDFKATHPAFPGMLSLRVASKKWLAPMDQPETYLGRLQSACLVSSPHIAGILDSGIMEEDIYVVQEWVDGCSLHDLVNEMGLMPVSLAAEYIRQAALGLLAAHVQGVLHGSLSPMVMLLTPVKRVTQPATGFVSVRPRAGATVKLINMALSPIRPPLGDVAFGNSEKLGEISYLAPERFGAAGPTKSGDLYGLGASLYFLLTSKAPFQGSSVIDVLVQLQQGEPTPIESIRDDIPQAISALIGRSLSRDCANRPSTEEFISTLLPFCEVTAMPEEAIAAAVPIASETFTGFPRVPELTVDETAPLVEPMTESQQIELNRQEQEEVDQFGQSDSPARVRPKLKPKKSLTWILVGLALHGTGILLLAGWLTNWFGLAKTFGEKSEEVKIEKKSDTKPPPKKKKSNPPQQAPVNPGE